MIVVEHNRIELDFCPNCSGVWFDAGELELLLESLGRRAGDSPLAGLLSLPEAVTSEKKHKCPICHRQMKKAGAGEPQVVVDVCPQRDGLWFDGGEVGHVINQCAPEPCTEAQPQGEVFSFLSDTFKGTKPGTEV
ncbi:MAG: zf-TFIIB domain-containing protein [Chloroflexi bacterium]|nr:zf-TFIIB domain-containing protein [Chloroflexota bacterium]